MWVSHLSDVCNCSWTVGKIKYINAFKLKAILLKLKCFIKIRETMQFLLLISPEKSSTSKVCPKDAYHDQSSYKLWEYLVKPFQAWKS